MKDVSARFDFKVMTEHIRKVLEKMETVQHKLEYDALKMEKDEEQLGKSIVSRLKLKKYLEEEVVQPLHSARVALRHIQFPRVKGNQNRVSVEEPLIDDFMPEEIRWYIIPKENKNGKVNICRTGRIYNTIGHACALVKKELEDYMDYDVGSYCKDDWNLAQKLILRGRDPFPRRCCLTIASEHYLKPYPINVTLEDSKSGLHRLHRML